MKFFVLFGFLVFASSCEDTIESTHSGDNAKTIQKKETKTNDVQTQNQHVSTRPFSAEEGFLIINGKKVNPTTFNDKMKLLGSFARVIGDKEIDEFVKQTVEDIANRELLRELVTRQSLPTKEVDAKLNQIKKANPDFKEHLQKLGQTEEELRSEIEESLKITAYIDSKITITEKNLRDLYERNIRNYRDDAAVRASHIFLKVEDPKKKKEILKKAKIIRKEALEKGSDFGELAKKYSQGPTKNKRGDLGWFTKKQMLPRFAKAAFKLKVAQISQPVWTERGYHIIRVEDKRSAKVKPMKSVQKELENTLRAKKRADMIRDLIRDARKTGKVIIDRKKITKNPNFKKGKGIRTTIK